MSARISTGTRRAALTVALVFGALLAAIATLGAIGRIFAGAAGAWVGRADLVTPRIPFVANWSEISKDGGDAYSGVTLASSAPLPVPRALLAVDSALSASIVIAGSLLVVLLAARLLRGRTFSRVARGGLAVVGILLAVKGALGPQLVAASTGLAILELDYPVFDASAGAPLTESSPEQVVVPSWDWLAVLARMDIALVLVGILLALGAALVTEGLRLQRDTEGLV